MKCMRCEEDRECKPVTMTGEEKGTTFQLCGECMDAFRVLVQSFMKALKQNKPFDDKTRMYFGEHKGKKLEDVPAQYLLWIADQSWMPQKHPKLLQYINRNRAGLEEEISEQEDEQ